MVISTFHRVHRACNSWANVEAAVHDMAGELVSLGYPLRVLYRAAGRLASVDAMGIYMRIGDVAAIHYLIDN